WWQSSTTDDWHTPQWLFDLLHKEFKFKLDVCATARNAKCKRYFTRRDDGLKQTWRGVCWMNPPYGREIGAWIEKAHQSAKDGATIACLVPARTDTAWWWDYCTRGEIRFLRGRLQFSKAENGAPFPSALVIFYPGVPKRNAKTIWWSVSDDNL
ncbi:MAG TPA: DNA N-6-adenine-methyltransferase, partial [Anaerolineae bacterium]